MPTELLIIGAGGHAKVVIEAIRTADQGCHILLTDQDKTKVGKNLLGNIPIKHLKNWEELPGQYHVAIGDNAERKQLNIVAQEQGKQLFTVIHPDACVSPGANVGNGSFIAAMAVIAAEVKIREGCIMNHGAIIDHDCNIGSFTHIAPNATLGGNVRVGAECLIGAGAIILPKVEIGDHVVIGAGAVVTCDVPNGQTVVGIPGRCIRPDE